MANMGEKMLELQAQAATDVEVSPGEVVVLSKDEQNLANLGYKQGILFNLHTCYLPTSTYLGSI